jgi:hypothetical protein
MFWKKTRSVSTFSNPILLVDEFPASLMHIFLTVPTVPPTDKHAVFKYLPSVPNLTIGTWRLFYLYVSNFNKVFVFNSSLTEL